MRRHTLLVLIALVGLIWWILATGHVLATGPTVKVTQVDPSRFPDVTIYVSVTDESGQPVGGFTKDDFQLFEDGHPVDIKEYLTELAEPMN